MKLPLIVSPKHVTTASSDQLKLVDLRPADDYSAGHVPGAIPLDTSLLGRSAPPTNGLLPDDAGIQSLIAALGLREGDHIVAYDAGKGTAAARLVWVLHAYGFERISWLDGGFAAWQAAGLALSTDTPTIEQANVDLQATAGNVISVEALNADLNNNNLAIIDVRSQAEFEGSDVRSARGGHVPNAQHSEWTNVFEADGTLKPDDILKEHFASLINDGNKSLIVYCQTHQRSALTYVVLKHLGYKNVSAIDGAWSAWGNNADVPIETTL